jgi:hypothetical protein
MQMDVDPSSKISTLKQQLGSEHQFDPEKLALIYKGSQLKDEATVEDSEIDGSTFVIIFHSARPCTFIRPLPVQSLCPESPPAPPPSPVTPPETVTGIRCSPLPPLMNFAAANDPPNFSELLKQLLNLGFDQSNCEEALRASLYKPEVAVEYLLAGWAPDPPPPTAPLLPVDLDALKDEGMLEIFHKLKSVKDEGLSLDVFINYLKDNHPYEHEVFNQSPSAFLSMLGFSSSDFILKSNPQPGTLYDSLIAHFTPEQREVIRRLESKGFDSMMVLQVYEACNFDETTTEECLKALIH